MKISKEDLVKLMHEEGFDNIVDAFYDAILEYADEMSDEGLQDRAKDAVTLLVALEKWGD